MNVPETVPEANVTEAGAVSTDDALLVMATTAVPVDGACDRVTVHTVPPFEASVTAVQLMPRRVGSGCSTIVAAAVLAFRLAVRVAVEYAVSVPVEIVKLTVVAPASTVTDDGAVNTVDPLFVRATTAPPGGAGPDNVTRHVVLPFTESVVKVHESPLTADGGPIEIFAAAVVPFRVAVSVAVWFTVSVPVEMLNVPLTVPAATVTVAGADNAGEALFASVTAAPPVDAAIERVTVHVVPLFEDKLVAMQESPRRVGSGCKVTVAVAVELFSVAVRVAV